MVFVFAKELAEVIKPVIVASYMGAAKASVRARGDAEDNYLFYTVHMDGNTPVVNGQRWIGAPRHRSTPVEKALHTLLLQK